MSADFHPLGALPATGKLSPDGLPIGTWKSQYRDGTRAAEISYSDDGKAEGIASQWASDGSLMTTFEFKEDGKGALERVHFPSGKVQIEREMVGGVHHGAVRIWNEDGQLSGEGSLHLGRTHGRIWEINNGKKSTEAKFLFGIPQFSDFRLVAWLNGGLRSIALLVIVVGAMAVAGVREFGAIQGILILALAIMIHEFGHWAVARCCGMPTTTFRVGVGPHLVSFYWQRTLFEIHLIPVIGWVKQATFYEGEWPQYQDCVRGGGESQAPIPIADDVSNVMSKPRPSAKLFSARSQIAFYLGGIGFNLLSAFLVLWMFTYPSRPDRAAAKCAQVAVGITVAIPQSITEQLKPDNIVKDRPGLLRGIRDSKRRGVTIDKHFAVVSILLAVFNLLPIPPLDGFHCLIAMIESVLGRPVEGKAVRWVMMVGTAFLLLLMATGVIFLGRDLIYMMLGN